MQNVEKEDELDDLFDVLTPEVKPQIKETVVENPMTRMFSDEDYKSLSFDQKYVAMALYQHVLFIMSGNYTKVTSKLFEIPHYNLIHQKKDEYIEKQRNLYPVQYPLVEERFNNLFSKYFPGKLEIRGNVLLVSGDPGSGKSKFIGFLINYIIPDIARTLKINIKKYCVAFSHSAVQSLILRTNAPGMTTAAASKAAPVNITEKDFDPANPRFMKSGGETLFQKMDIVILDECGVEPQESINELQLLYKHNPDKMLIMFGDINQNAPVADKQTFGGAADGKAFEIAHHEYRLITPHRIGLFHPVQQILDLVAHDLDCFRSNIKRDPRRLSIERWLLDHPTETVKTSYGLEVGFKRITVEDFKKKHMLAFLEKNTTGSITNVAAIAYTNKKVKAINQTIQATLYPKRMEQVGFGYIPNMQVMSYANITRTKNDWGSYTILQIMTNSCNYKVIYCSSKISKRFEMSMVDDSNYMLYGQQSFDIKGYSVLIKNLHVSDMEDTKDEKAFVQRFIDADSRGATITLNDLCGSYSNVFVVDPESYPDLMRLHLEYVTIKVTEDGLAFTNKLSLHSKVKMKKAQPETRKTLRTDYEYLRMEFLVQHDIYYRPITDEWGYPIYWKYESYKIPYTGLAVDGTCVKFGDQVEALNGENVTTTSLLISKSLDMGDALTSDKLQGGERDDIFAFMDDIKISKNASIADFLKKLYVISSRSKRILYLVYDT